MKWPMTALGEVASLERRSLVPEDIKSGTNYLGLEHFESGGRILGYQKVGEGELQSNKFIFDPGTLLYGKLRPYLAKVCIPDREGCCSTDILPIRPGEHLDIGYLRHLLLWKPYVDKAASLCAGANLPRISPSALLAIEIPLPPLEEQQRIAVILDKAARIDELCGAACKLSQASEKSLFLKFFADQPEGDGCLLEGLADSRPNAIRTGPFGSQLLHSEFTDSGIAVLGIDNAVNNCFEWGKKRFVSNEKYMQLKRYTVFPGDLLVTIMGTCGRVAVVPDDIPLAINTKHLCAVSIDRRVVLPEYLHSYMLFHPSASRYLAQRTKGAIMEGLNMAIIKEMPLTVPPMSQQLDWLKRRTIVKSVGKGAQAMTASASSLSQSLSSNLLEGRAA